jgi:2-polyprenyl-3-methyl-5-hydroxy-6-metoxy-1,4-benzoquinol methylase
LITTIPADRRERIAGLDFNYTSQPKEAVTTCNLCKGTVFTVLTHRDRYGYAAQANACNACGLVFLSPRMTAEAYGRFYDGTYRPLVSAFHGRRIDAETIQDEQREYAQERAELLEPYIKGSGLKTMLDIGGSTGVVAHHFARAFDLSGTLIDPAPLEVEQARGLGLETITGLVEQYEFGYRTFDVVVVCQTVDHLLDISGTLARVRHLMTGNGLFFIDIVDFRAAYLRGWSVEDAIKIDHPYYLTQETITAYLRRAGFEILRADYAADHLHVGYVCAPGNAEPGSTPHPQQVDALLREVRFVQNAPRP